ncbi:MAG: molybdopterin-dependent oxidoreductase, partial [Magnetovibrio sp.]|nr:molybdopterin-dependent oxidoreductase [Magnetovibrio sp.]
PLRGQNNVQGASDAGLIPIVLPDYAKVDDDQARKRFEDAWKIKLNPTPGLTVVEIMRAALTKDIRAMYIMGENPAMSDPDLNKTRKALATLDHLLVQDIFFTETAAFADVILPATSFFEKNGTFTNSNRQVQLGHKVIPPPGDAREDLWIIQGIANRLGLQWDYPDANAVFEEMRSLMPSHLGISHARIQKEGSVTYPAKFDGLPGKAVLFGDGFPTPSGKATLVPAVPGPPDEQTDQDYPFILTTGRMLEHWHTGAISRRARVLDSLEPGAFVSLNPKDAANLGLDKESSVKVTSRRGELSAPVRFDEDTPQGVVFIPFAFCEAAANLLTNPALDPFGKIAEVKYCAVKVEKASTPKS